MNHLAYFDTVDTRTLCRGGGNGPEHLSQIKGLELVGKGESLLDVGCGSGTTYECIKTHFPEKEIKYKGVDAVAKHIEWCQKTWPEAEWQQENAIHLKEMPHTWDTVWSRHVVDHLPSFEVALTEFLRVAKKRIIVILWFSFSGSGKHEISQVHYDKDYVEFLNTYGKQPVIDFLNKQTGWKYTITEGVSPEEKKTVPTDGDVIIHLEKL